MNTNNISIIKMTKVDLPLYKEQRGKEWITYGADNAFPNKLVDLANRSALHNAILSSKVDHIIGNGLTYEKKNSKTTDAFLDNPNPNETLDDIFRKISYDFELYGGYCLNVIWSKDRKSIAEVYHIDFSKLRSGIADERGIVTEYWYSKDWTNYRRTENTPKRIAAFSTNKGTEASQLIWVKQYYPGIEYYPIPSYVGALAYIEIDAEIANFHLSHIQNGMSPSILLNFNNGIPTEDERIVIERKVKEKYNGTDNAGNVMLTFSEDASKAPTVTTISPSQLDKQFIQLQETVLQNILSGHKVVSPMLVGISTPGQLGGASELQNSYMIYEKSVIKPSQSVLLRTINKITDINGLEKLEIIPNTPVEFSWSENVLQTILSKDEMREKIGLDPLIESIENPDSTTNLT